MVFYYKILYNKKVRIARKNVGKFMKKERGFVLAETLVVAVAVMGIFSLLYANFYPLIGEYERREVYDDIDTKYAAHWVRKILVEKKGSNLPFTLNSCGNTCHVLYASYYKDIDEGETVRRVKQVLVDETESVFLEQAPFMQNYITASNIRAILITRYRLTDFKNYVKTHETMSFASQGSLINKQVFNRGFREYIDYLPEFKSASSNGAGYRVIVILDHDTSREYDSYGTIEVRA